MPNNGSVDKTLTADDATYTVPAGYHVGTGTVKIVPEEKTATPSKSTQSITPTTGKILSKVTIDPIPASYQDVTAVDAEAVHVLEGKKIVTVDGTVVTGSMANNGAVNGSLDGLTVLSFNIPAGYTTGGTVSLTNDIENALAAI
jgi:hypothetical protein